MARTVDCGLCDGGNYWQRLAYSYDCTAWGGNIPQAHCHFLNSPCGVSYCKNVVYPRRYQDGWDDAHNHCRDVFPKSYNYAPVWSGTNTPAWQSCGLVSGPRENFQDEAVNGSGPSTSWMDQTIFGVDIKILLVLLLVVVVVMVAMRYSKQTKSDDLSESTDPPPSAYDSIDKKW